MITFGVASLALNAGAHVMQFFRLRQDPNAQPSEATGVGAFAVIDGLLAGLVGLGFAWAQWPALILPLLGGLGLAATFRTSGGSRNISVAILILDLLCVLIFGYLLFLA